MNKYLLLLLLLFLTTCFNCHKEPPKICPIFFPVQENSKLNFLSYVTNEKNEMLYPFEYFERRYIYSDTIDQRSIHYYIERNQLAAFYTDDSCSIFNRLKIDLSAYAASFGFQYQDSLYLTYWKPVIKINKGIGTNWQVKVDTVFKVMDIGGKEHLLQYHFYGLAEYTGWSKVIIPLDRTNKFDAMQVQWHKIKYFLYDQTADDSLLVQEGDASDYFDPKLGLIRSISDHFLALKGKPKTFQKSTWELYSTFIP